MATIKINPPCIITSRLCVGVEIGDKKTGGVVSIKYSKRPGDEGRVRYQWYVDLKNGKEFQGDDLQSGRQGGDLRSGLESLLGFMEAAGESWNYNDERGLEHDNPDSNESMFDRELSEWCGMNTDELGMARIEIEENENVIDETT